MSDVRKYVQVMLSKGYNSKNYIQIIFLTRKRDKEESKSGKVELHTRT